MPRANRRGQQGIAKASARHYQGTTKASPKYYIKRALGHATGLRQVYVQCEASRPLTRQHGVGKTLAWGSSDANHSE